MREHKPGDVYRTEAGSYMMIINSQNRQKLIPLWINCIMDPGLYYTIATSSILADEVSEDTGYEFIMNLQPIFDILEEQRDEQSKAW